MENNPSCRLRALRGYKNNALNITKNRREIKSLTAYIVMRPWIELALGADSLKSCKLALETGKSLVSLGRAIGAIYD
jgi:hypothetical protein